MSEATIQDSVAAKIKALYEISHNLEELFPGRHYTPDGHMIGSIGEALAASYYNLELFPASEETQRITAIVERVRGYAKAHMRALEPVDWTKIVRSAVTIVRRHDSQCAPIRILNGEYLKNSPQDDVCAKVLGEPLELELLVINLVRNASQAV